MNEGTVQVMRHDYIEERAKREEDKVTNTKKDWFWAKSANESMEETVDKANEQKKE